MQDLFHERGEQLTRRAFLLATARRGKRSMEIINGKPALSGDRDFGFKVLVDGADLLVLDTLCAHRDNASWFGGPADKEDDGNTASGTPDHVYGVMGCSLPVNGRNNAACDGSPIPRLPWRIMVRVYCHSTGKQIEVPLIDIGPSFGTDHAIDLTEAAFNALGLSLDTGLTGCDFRILGGSAYLSDDAKAAISAAGFSL